jgi:hypothetical protein
MEGINILCENGWVMSLSQKLREMGGRVKDLVSINVAIGDDSFEIML